jgi:hypothetical protein
VNDKDIEERLHSMFQRKLLEMWKEDPPPVCPEGMYDTAHRIRNAQRWIEYVEGLGGQILDWKGAINHDHGVLFHNPCEHPKDFGTAGAEPRYIFLPEEIALKIFVLGEPP